MNSAGIFDYLSCASYTDTGRRRMKNEDAILCLQDHGLFIVADGMGGAGGGDVASKAVIDHIREKFTATGNLGLNEKIELFRTTLDDASRWIKARADRDKIRGMGCTVVGLMFDSLDRRRAAILHAGDSRVYVYRNDTLTKLMVDHSPAAEAGIDDESLVPFFMQGIITRAVGVRSSVKLELTYIDIKEGDQLILCSDGLYNMLSDDELVKVLTSSADENEIVRAAIKEANEAGGLDNISVIHIRVEKENS